MANLAVMKFGGTSVGDAAGICRAAEIIASTAREQPVVAVVSAMSGITNALIAAAGNSATGDQNAAIEIAEALRLRHHAVIDATIKAEARRTELSAEIDRIVAGVGELCHGTALLRELTPRTLAAISTAGERLSARLLAAALCELAITSLAIDATEVIVTDDDYARPEPLMKETCVRATARLLPLLEEGVTPVVTGFIGATTKGIVTTLGRGGSDYSATILGATLEADKIIIWTDVDGVLTADPRLVPQARLLSEISYNEAAELAYFGAKVLHPKTLRPVADSLIPVWIRNSSAPERAGTKITRRGQPSENGVKAITAMTNVSLITVGGRGIVGVIGVAAKTFAAAASVRANVLLISQSSSESDICFVVDSGDAERTLGSLKKSFAADLLHHHVEHIAVNPDIAVIAAVGENMRGTPGIAGRLFSALGRRGVNVIAIAQGSSEYNVSFVVEAAAMQDAAIAIHEEFDLGRAS
ncbi:MAG TPA: aspartate kinase [Pyrinomonadaceae bacterium]|nr:aspartate kinase [Pyrinomonadaceae bacterium]